MSCGEELTSTGCIGDATAATAAEGLTADAGMLDALRRKDAEALAELARRHSPGLMKAAWLYLGDAHAAEDAVQETLIAAWDSARRTDGRTRLRSWLLGILMNRCRKHIRSAQRRRRRERAVAGQRGEASSPQMPDERLTRLQAALADLDEAHRAAVILRYQQGLSVEEAAGVLGIPAGTVKSRCHAAVARLRQIMETGHETDG